MKYHRIEDGWSCEAETEEDKQFLAEVGENHIVYVGHRLPTSPHESFKEVISLTFPRKFHFLES